MSDTTVTTEAPATNTPDAREPDGTLKDQSSTTTTSTETTQPETEAKPDAKATVPEAYEFKAPDNYTVDKTVVEKVTPVFKELGLSQEAAQKLFDLQVERELTLAKGPQEAYEALRKEWRDTILKNTTLAQNNDLRPEVKSAISKGIDTLGTDLAKSFREVMDTSGLGDHPAVVEALYKFAQSVTEGSHVTGKGPSPTGQKAPDAAPPTVAKAMFPNLK